LLEENDNSVAVAYGGEQASKLGTENSYDTIILDMMITRMNGFDVCRSLCARTLCGRPSSCSRLAAPQAAPESDFLPGGGRRSQL
jgi:CheY-like chemotaxis protein